MGSFILWWLLVTLIGFLALPIAWRLFPALEDRGFGFTRIVGLAATSYVFWLTGSFQLIRLNSGGVIVAIFSVAVIAFLVSRNQVAKIIEWVRSHRSYVISVELLFLIAFAFWAFVRANNPAITATEKPMELAFLNAIMDSDGFPAKDPWLSGYAISYYYFGYVMLAMLTLLSGIAAGAAFNLGNALWFALVAIGSYSLVYNLLARREGAKVRASAALLGPLFVLVTGNLEAILDVLHARHIFWQVDETGSMVSRFWTWIGLENLELPPFGDPSWIPQRNWWWWRASRVIRDLDLQGNPIDLQSIDEFPFFSFLLADNHPHLLAMPFVLLAVAFSLQIFFRSRPITIQKRFDEISDRAKNTLLALAGLGLLMVIPTSLSSALQETTLPSSLLFSLLSDLVLYGLAFGAVSFVVLLLLGYGQIPLTRQELLVGGLIFGSLAYLNTWDFPIYLSLFFGVLLLKASRTSTLTALRQSITGTLGLLILGVGFYLPWYPTFASQAGGILPHVLHPTRFLHFFIMFGTALVPIAVWLGMKFSQESEGRDWIRLIVYGIGLPILLMVLMLLLALMVYTFVDPMILERAFSMMPASSFGEAVNMIITTRIMTSWTAWVLGLIFGAGFLVLRSSWIKSGETNPDQFVIILVLIGALLVIGPEFFYLRDQFGLRMNTIFKFYFAAWILWGLAAAYAVNAIGQRRPKRFLGLQILVIIPLLFGLIYPVIGTWTKTDGFNPPFGRTLNGSMYPSYAPEADRTAVMWIDENLEDGVIAEAVGGSYTYYARISAHTGLPTVIGWPGHESQWRGGYVEIGNRESDIRTVYTSPDWDQTEKILQQYAIDYVYIGPLERSSYRPLVEQKFMAYMDLIYQNEEVRIYATRERSAP
ncbi:MAG: DUF2298 domain-containing protein [Anaerolineales bacterium]|jgi:uncharacterized membrane protein